MRLTSFLQSSELTIILKGEIDHHTAKEYILEITSKLEAYLPKSCVLDFQDVTFMDSSGIAVVINALRHMSRMDGVLYISGLCEQPRKVFCAAGIDKLVKIKEAIF